MATLHGAGVILTKVTLDTPHTSAAFEMIRKVCGGGILEEMWRNGSAHHLAVLVPPIIDRLGVEEALKPYATGDVVMS